MHCISAPSQLWQSGALRSRYTGLLYLVDAGAQHSNSAEFSIEQTGSQAWKQQHNIRLLFKIKHCVDTNTQISKKRQTQVTITITAVASDHVIITGTPLRRDTSCLLYLHHGGLKTQPVGIAGLRSKTGSEPQRSRHISSGNSGLLIPPWFLVTVIVSQVPFSGSPPQIGIG